jgi:hypothetical protein
VRDPNIAEGSLSVPDAASISMQKGIPGMPVPKQHERRLKRGHSGNPKGEPRGPMRFPPPFSQNAFGRLFRIDGREQK